MTTDTRQRKRLRACLYKACLRCHGDLILDADSAREDGRIGYVCLQCGRRFAAGKRGARRTETGEEARSAA
jgi:hypothetical protein